MAEATAGPARAARSRARTAPDTAAEPPPVLLLALFSLLAVGLTFPNVTRLRTFVAGDSGDSILNLWIIRRVEIGLPHGWNAFWNAPIYFPAHRTLAYSDTLLPVALVHWPLRTVLGDVLAFNVVYLGAWVLASWSTYRLARRVTRHPVAALVGALAYTYAALRLVHHAHFQLVVGGALVPLCILALVTMLERPSPVRGALLGVAFAAVALSASYYGALMAVVIIVVAGGNLIWSRGSDTRACIRGLVAAVGVTAVLVGPIALEYVSLQRHPEFRRGFEPASAAHVGDFLSTGPSAYVLRHVPAISPRSRPSSRGIENRLFPGFVALVFGAAGAVVLIRRRRRWRDPPWLDLVLLCAAGAVLLILSFGDWVTLHGHRVYLPFVVFRHLVPGFAGIRAVARLALGAELALALVAAVGVDAALARMRVSVRGAAGLAIAGVVVAESAMGLTLVRVPTVRDDGGVAQALRALPRGPVLELPIESSARGSVWPFVEAPRQLLALHDHDPRVNGYSGFQPKGFDALAATLDAFPSPSALAAARALGVRYVVIRTALVGPVTPSVLTPVLAADGAGRYDATTAGAIVDRIPPGALQAPPRPLPGGYLLELAG